MNWHLTFGPATAPLRDGSISISFSSRTEPIERENRHRRDEREDEHAGRNRTGVSHAEEAERLFVHVGGHQFGCAVGTAFGHDENEVEIFQRTDRRQRRGRDDRRHEERQLDAGKRFPRRAPVDAGRFEQLFRNAGEPCAQQNHVERDKLPADGGNDRAHRRGFFPEPAPLQRLEAEVGQQFIEHAERRVVNEHPQNGDRDRGHQERQKIDRPEKAHAPDFRLEQQGQRQSERNLREDGGKDEQDVVAERPEKHAVPHQIGVVFQPEKRLFRLNPRPVEQAVVKGCEDRVDVVDRIDEQGGPDEKEQKQPFAPLVLSADASRIAGHGQVTLPRED